MRTVGMKVLKNRLSEYVKLARGGETVFVTDREQVVAELRPPSGQPSDAIRPRTEAEIMDDLVRRGLASPARTRLTGPPPRHPIMSFEEMMRDLDESREDRV
ncbi:MAG: prevent-host-death protein [Bauldia sp.]|nr:prevent-host-death protein [Bauldia sp.]